MSLNPIGTLGFVIGVSFIANTANADDCVVVFQQKVFTDGGEFVSVHGTLAGNGVPYEYNEHKIDCSLKQRHFLITIQHW
jgi:hypothetical protein